VKLEVMQSHISFLEEQHSMFLQTMEQLVQQAGDHVSLVQEKLGCSSQAVLAYLTKKKVILQKVCAAVYYSLYCSERVETLRMFGL
jgi:hypothetical protein